ncbi:MAG: rubrerythrin [Chloroflexi bacterium HGW-Chloroflexi-8]|jgi:rubrerythrin|nr:MAG: rubrerythrin [Chloroflexi bacterium HGW-Chloroflexi-8]
MSKSTEGLKSAFAGESQANRKYMSFAEAAEKEGLKQIAKLFRAAAHAEAVHAATHFRTLGGVQATIENLKSAIDGESYEVMSMYPEFMKYAEEEENKRALSSFRKAYEVEKVHEGLYREALKNLEAGNLDTEEYDYYVCPVCGFTHARNAPDKCPVCGAPGDKFERIQ